MYVFVYGTLRHGGPLYNAYLGGKKPLYSGRVNIPSWPAVMTHLGAFPALVSMLKYHNHPDKKAADFFNQTHDAVSSNGFVGDVFAINADTLSALDRAEGVPLFYQRRSLMITLGPDADPEVFKKNEPRASSSTESLGWVSSTVTYASPPATYTTNRAGRIKIKAHVYYLEPWNRGGLPVIINGDFNNPEFNDKFVLPDVDEPVHRKHDIGEDLVTLAAMRGEVREQRREEPRFIVDDELMRDE